MHAGHAPFSIQSLLVVTAFVLAGFVVWYLDRPRGRWGQALRKRFMLSLPWGTLVTAAGLLAAYLFLQGGLSHWNNPMVIPFRAWSYFYPLGMVTSSFTHVGPGHLLGNLTGTLALAPIAEYAWGHFPRRRGSTSFGSLRTNPYVRAFVIFPAAVSGVGLLTSVFAIGPVIGFSGVVFAFAGFGLVRYPVGTLVALFASQALGTVRLALFQPVNVAEARPIFYTPWWASIAIQGHAIGLLFGVLLGAYWFAWREDVDGPSALRLWGGVLLFGIAQSLWAIYWYRGGSTYVLYRAVGIVLVIALATLVAVSLRASDRPLVPARFSPLDSRSLAPAFLLGALAAFVAYWRFGGAPTVSVDAYVVSVPAAVGGVLLVVALVLFAWRPGIPIPFRSVPRWQAGLAVLLIATAAISGPAIPINLLTVSGEELPGEEVQVREYQITYAEDVPNGMVSVIDVEAFGETTQVNTSGVIVRNPSRGIWTTAVHKGQLKFDGNATVRVGGIWWRESITASRRGWVVADGNNVYRVVLVDDGRVVSTYTSKPAVADPTIAHRNISLVATDQRFEIAVAHNNTTVHRPIPSNNSSVTALGIEFVRKNETLVATHNGTRIRIAKEETYH